MEAALFEEYLTGVGNTFYQVLRAQLALGWMAYLCYQLKRRCQLIALQSYEWGLQVYRYCIPGASSSLWLHGLHGGGDVKERGLSARLSRKVVVSKDRSNIELTIQNSSGL